MMLNPSLLKAPLILLNAICVHRATAPPTPPPDLTERKKYDTDDKTRDALSRHTWWTVKTFLIVMYSLVIGEVYAIISSEFPAVHVPSLDLLLLPSTDLPHIRQFYLSNGFILGSLLIYIGTYIRVACYRHLGRHFTFELALKKEHKLITDGPYSVVRHPGYAGLVMAYSGLIISEMGSGSWWAECQLWDVPFWRVLGLSWISFVVAISSMLLSRVPKEDMVLRNEFKAQWEEWSKKTPYRLFPYIY